MKEKIKQGLGMFIMVYLFMLIMGGACTMNPHEIEAKEFFLFTLLGTVAIFGMGAIFQFAIWLMNGSDKKQNND